MEVILIVQSQEPLWPTAWQSVDRSCYRQEMEQILMQERAKALRMQWALEANKNERGLFLMAKLSGTLQAMYDKAGVV